MQIGITAEQAEKMLEEKAALSRDAGKVDNDQSNEENKDEGGDDDNVPFHKHPRFQQLAKENREFKAKLAEIDRNKAQEMKEAKKEFKLDPNTPFDEAMKQIKAEAVREAIEAMKEEQNQANSQTSYYENLINEGFDYLRDNGHKISQKDEDAIAEIALEYKINIEQPEDLERAFKIYDLSRKSSGAGKAQEDSTITKNRNAPAKGPDINYSQTSWSNLGNRIAERL
jgi:hypothetical protein